MRYRRWCSGSNGPFNHIRHVTALCFLFFFYGKVDFNIVCRFFTFLCITWYMHLRVGKPMFAFRRLKEFNYHSNYWLFGLWTPFHNYTMFIFCSTNCLYICNIRSGIYISRVIMSLVCKPNQQSLLLI